MHAPIFYLLNIKIGAQSEQIWHLLRDRSTFRLSDLLTTLGCDSIEINLVCNIYFATCNQLLEGYLSKKSLEIRLVIL